MIKAIQEYYDEEFAYCYGCGRKNTEGHHLKTYLKDDITINLSSIISNFHRSLMNSEI